MTNVISSDSPIGRKTQQVLRSLAELMIPETDTMPSAADEAIFAGIVKRLAPNADSVADAVWELDSYAVQETDCGFTELDAERRMQILDRSGLSQFRQLFQMAVLPAYYQDDRVMMAIGLPPRPAWPEGYEIDPTDWSLVDPVKARGPIWREPDTPS
ncbi:MAG: gluconate 2-dehydrogenase subunit 3 family protein [Gammaproteobacteria bacterium]|nr:gluconate 2-dehydrogenase subunit 3 family protein [Gammaproteobacteria bacterium]